MKLFQWYRLERMGEEMIAMAVIEKPIGYGIFYKLEFRGMKEKFGSYFENHRDTVAAIRSGKNITPYDNRELDKEFMKAIFESENAQHTFRMWWR
jgi:hypothetical protein